MNRRDTPHILLINPWIHDFAAYDFWAKPLGLLSLTSVLAYHDFNVSYIDCLERFHPEALKTDPFARYGRGPYLKTMIPNPEVLKDVVRNYSRYGIKKQWFKKDLLSILKPDLILITSLMTYWYTGVQETIAVIKEVFPKIPLVLGGIYASLYPNHARKLLGVDRVVTGPFGANIFKLIKAYTGFSMRPRINFGDMNAYPYPAFYMQKKITYIPLLTSRGCPFSCKYCASNFLNPKRLQRDPKSVVEEIEYWHKKFDAKDFAFYDDAFLVDAKKHAIPILEGIIKSGLDVRFHTPNAIHIKEISKESARMMFMAGFKTIRIGLETAIFEKRTELDKKVTKEDFFQAVSFLNDAGFTKNQVGAYLLVGLPDQSIYTIENSIETVRKTGITPVLAYYSPIPHTALWNKAVKFSRYDLESDPLLTNNAIMPSQPEAFSWKTISYLKKLASM